MVCFILLCFFVCSQNYSQKLFIAKNEQNKYGIIDSKGIIKIEFNYNNISLDCAYYKLTDSNNRIGLLTSKLNAILKCEYEAIKCDCSNIIVVKHNGKFGYFSNNGKMLVDFKFDDAGLFWNDSALVKNDGKLYWINQKGNIIKSASNNDENYLNDKYSQQEEFSGIMFPDDMKEENGLNGIFVENKWIVKPIYKSIYTFGDNYYLVEKDKLYGLIDLNGNIIIPIKYIEMK